MVSWVTAMGGWTVFGALLPVSVGRYDTHAAAESIGGYVIGALASVSFIAGAWTVTVPALSS